MTPDPLLTEAMERLLAREDIGREGAARAVGVIMDGGADDAQIAGFLIALRAKGESAGELAGLAEAVRARAEAVSVDDALHLVDTCGTGGGPSTINISTGSAFLGAGAGAHGDRADEPVATRGDGHGAKPAAGHDGDGHATAGGGLELGVEPCPCALLPKQGQRGAPHDGTGCRGGRERHDEGGHAAAISRGG